MPTLDSICQEVATVVASLDDCPEVLREEMERRVAEHIEKDLDLPAKVNAVAAYLRQLQAEAEHLQGRAEELDAKAKAKRRRIERFKGYVLGAMQRNGLHALKGQEATLSRRKSERVEVIDCEAVPSEYKVVTTTTSVVKDRIKVAIKRGESVPGARIVQGESLQVR